MKIDANARYAPLISGTDFTVTTSASSGVPVITYTESTTINAIYNEYVLIVYE